MWQAAHPMLLNTVSPAVVAAVGGCCGIGASNDSNCVILIILTWFTSCGLFVSGWQAVGKDSPCGRCSLELNMLATPNGPAPVVMPISLNSASALNWKSET